MRRWFGWVRSERGQSSVEFVLILPIFLLLFFAMVDFGWALKNWVVVTNAVREEARCQVVSCAPPGETALDRMTGGLTSNLSGQTVDVHYVDTDGDGEIGPGDSVIACVRADNEYISPVVGFFSMVTGGALPDPLPLGAREEMRLEVAPGAGATVGDTSCGF